MAKRGRRGVFVQLELPRHVIPKKLASGKVAFFYNTPSKYRALGCPLGSEPLGVSYDEMKKRAETLNGLFDEWDQHRKGLPVSAQSATKYGTVDWLFREYKASDAYLKKVAPRSRKNYEWAMGAVCNVVTKKGDRVGDRMVKTISPRAADKLLKYFNTGTKGQTRPRTGHKLAMLCRKAWKVVRRLYPDEFDKKEPNPWVGVTLENRIIAKKHAVTREQVYTLHGAALRKANRRQPLSL